MAMQLAASEVPIPRQIAATAHWTNGRAMASDGRFRGVDWECMAVLVNDERQVAARNENFGTKTAAHCARLGGIDARQRARIATAIGARIPPRIAARLHVAARQRALEPVDRRPARPPVLGQDYGRRPHRCLQSGSVTSRRP